MEQDYYDKVNPLKYINIKESTDEIIKYIDNRRKGINSSLKTRWKKFNSQCMGGIEPNTIYSICGISGSGKSSFINSLESDLFDLNPNKDFVVLNFNFEMLSSKQVGRKLSYKTKKTTSELYSGIYEKLSEKDFNSVVKESEKIKQYPIYYVDVPGTVSQIYSTIMKFMNTEGYNKWIIIILDHTLLTRGKSGESEREVIAKLQYMFMQIKKLSRNTIIQLSQMNRNIESVDRITNQTMHFPMRTVVFGSDSLFQGSDYVIVLHRPELLGILNSPGYGAKHFPTKGFIYMHILKNREGEPSVIQFENNLKYNEINEVSKPITKGETNIDDSSLTIFDDL
jgi:replicative DNA helicase